MKLKERVLFVTEALNILVITLVVVVVVIVVVVVVAFCWFFSTGWRLVVLRYFLSASRGFVVLRHFLSASWRFVILRHFFSGFLSRLFFSGLLGGRWRWHWRRCFFSRCRRLFFGGFLSGLFFCWRLDWSFFLWRNLKLEIIAARAFFQ